MLSNQIDMDANKLVCSCLLLAKHVTHQTSPLEIIAEMRHDIAFLFKIEPIVTKVYNMQFKHVDLLRRYIHTIWRN